MPKGIFGYLFAAYLLSILLWAKLSILLWAKLTERLFGPSRKDDQKP